MRDLRITHAGAEHPSPREISFDVHAGEVVLLLGPSGSGKSTLTLALNGLIPQSVPADVDGTVEVAGLSTADTPVAQLSEHVAMVFQDPDAQLVTGTVLDEVAFALENQLLPVDEVLGRAEAALRRVDLWERRSWNPDLLSGGGRQRIAIACALAMGSRMLVLDEPTANLDPQGTADVHAAIADVVAEGDRAVLLVEHDYEAALGFATRVVELGQDGRLVFDGDAALWGRSAMDTPGRDRNARHDVSSLRLASLAQHGARSQAPSLNDRGGRLSPRSLSERRRSETKRPQQTTDITSAVSVHDLRVRKQRDEILRIDDLEITAGSFTAVVGANGAGKTTLIQALAGVVPPEAGTVRIAGLDAGTASPRQLAARVGFVFQNPEHQFIAHTVFDELAHGLRLQHV
ncbi:MAG: ABC transporter ATP-binding protein, partial [Microbacterium sp.]|nr:ABC transporter ATP-binding protein [Microbacterium sp.]